MENKNNLDDIKESELSKNDEVDDNFYQIPIQNKEKRKTVIQKMYEKELDEKKLLERKNKEDFNKAIEEAFNSFDKDNSDFISKDELGDFMKSMGYKLSEIELEEIIKSVDTNGNGIIGLKEFRTMIAKNINDEMNTNISIEAFGIFDKGRTERMNCDILKALLLTKDKSRRELDFTEEEIEDIFKNINIDNDNNFNYRELVKSTFDIFSIDDI